MGYKFYNAIELFLKVPGQRISRELFSPPYLVPILKILTYFLTVSSYFTFPFSYTKSPIKFSTCFFPSLVVYTMSTAS